MCAAVLSTLPVSVMGDERRCRVAWQFPVLDPPSGIMIMATSQRQRAC